MEQNMYDSGNTHYFWVMSDSASSSRGKYIFARRSESLSDSEIGSYIDACSGRNHSKLDKSTAKDKSSNFTSFYSFNGKKYYHVNHDQSSDSEQITLIIDNESELTDYTPCETIDD